MDSILKVFKEILTKLTYELTKPENFFICRMQVELI